MNQQADPKTLDFVVIGAQKAGSTFVMQCLQDHPNIYMPHGETPFFQDPDYATDRIHILEKEVAPAKANQLRGIKRPNYLGQAEVPERIAKHMPGGKIIAVLREPVSRAISAYFHFLLAGHIPLVPVNQGLRAILAGEWKSRYPLSETILTYGLYDQHLQRYARHFTPEQTRVIVLDDVGKDPDRVVQSLYRFLGVDDTIAPKRTEQRPMAARYSLNRLRIYSLLRPLIFSTSPDRSRIHARPGTKYLRYGIGAFDQLILARLFPATKPPIEGDVKQALKAYFEKDVEQLRVRLSHPLEGW
ncbi:MAG: sulfotransferase domain-containing protein [Phycisphaeraceae bacterium]